MVTAATASSIKHGPPSPAAESGILAAAVDLLEHEASSGTTTPLVHADVLQAVLCPLALGSEANAGLKLLRSLGAKLRAAADVLPEADAGSVLPTEALAALSRMAELASSAAAAACAASLTHLLPAGSTEWQLWAAATTAALHKATQWANLEGKTGSSFYDGAVSLTSHNLRSAGTFALRTALAGGLHAVQTQPCLNLVVRLAANCHSGTEAALRMSEREPENLQSCRSTVAALEDVSNMLIAALAKPGGRPSAPELAAATCAVPAALFGEAAQSCGFPQRQLPALQFQLSARSGHCSPQPR